MATTPETELRHKLEKRSWGIWRYVRENRDSLDSHTACKMIREMVDEATADCRLALKQERVETKRLREVNRKLRAEVKTLTPHPTTV